LACEEGKVDAANLLLQALEIDLSAIGDVKGEHREATEMLEAAFDLHEKLTSSR